MPHVVPVCFGLAEDRLYITIDRKPKREGGRPLKRLRNIAANPRAAIVFDRYDEDWRRLAWVMLHGRAEILAAGPEHDRAQALLQARYRQLAAMQIEAASRHRPPHRAGRKLGRSRRLMRLQGRQPTAGHSADRRRVRRTIRKPTIARLAMLKTTPVPKAGA